MIIDKAWLMKCRTPNGGFTHEQFNVLIKAGLDITYPPQKGWTEKIYYHVLDDKLAKEFLQARNVKISKKGNKKIVGDDCTFDLFNCNV